MRRWSRCWLQAVGPSTDVTLGEIAAAIAIGAVIGVVTARGSR
jgi:hypothetical protein